MEFIVGADESVDVAFKDNTYAYFPIAYIVKETKRFVYIEGKDKSVLYPTKTVKRVEFLKNKEEE